jgi:hypothetical protein
MYVLFCYASSFALETFIALRFSTLDLLELFSDGGGIDFDSSRRIASHRIASQNSCWYCLDARMVCVRVTAYVRRYTVADCLFVTVSTNNP